MTKNLKPNYLKGWTVRLVKKLTRDVGFDYTTNLNHTNFTKPSPSGHSPTCHVFSSCGCLWSLERRSGTVMDSHFLGLAAIVTVTTFFFFFWLYSFMGLLCFFGLWYSVFFFFCSWVISLYFSLSPHSSGLIKLLTLPVRLLLSSSVFLEFFLF